ncbi:MAG: hypothetical protein ACU85E_06300 [Gammaproteobacteria bacterium]
MPPDPLKKALLNNKILIVKRTLRLTSQAVDETKCAEIDEDDLLEVVEAKLSLHQKPATTGNGEAWFRRLLKR